MSSSPTSALLLFGRRPAPNLRDEILKNRRKRKKNGVEVTRGNRLKKEKRWKDLDALAQSSLAFNPYVSARSW